MKELFACVDCGFLSTLLSLFTRYKDDLLCENCMQRQIDAEDE